MVRGKGLQMPWIAPDDAYESPVAVRKAPFVEMVFVGDPEIARHILIEQPARFPKAEMELKFFAAIFGEGLLGIDGELWRTHRRIMAPAFAPVSVASYAPAMTRCAEGFAEGKSGLADGAVVDVSSEMTDLTLSIIAQTMFSGDGEAVEPLIREALASAPLFDDVNLCDFAPVVRDLRMRARERRMAKVFGPLDQAIEAMIAARESGGRAAEDLLSRLIAARDGETRGRLSAAEVRDEVITIFVAGHETTATALTWTWYMLARHPWARERLHQELAEVLGGRTPTQADLQDLAYTRRIVDETLRLLPPAPTISARVAAEACELGGRKVRKGAYVLVAPWVIQRHTKTWEDPERFDPDRFTPERSERRPRLAAMPFGAGPHVCIGQRLAVNEVVLVLATLAQRYVFDLASDAPVELVANVTIRPQGGLPMRLTRRGPPPAAAHAA
jgi:cytochrome P450